MMIFSDPIILESENFLLRRLQLEDFEDLFKAASNPEIWLQHPEPDRYCDLVLKGILIK